MAKYGLAATPVNYAVFYEYVAEANPELKSGLDQLIQGQEEITNAEVEQLYDKYLTSVQSNRANTYSEQVIGLVEKMFDSAGAAGDEASRFSRTLEDFGEGLQNDSSDAIQLRIIENLIDDTRSMQTATRDLQQQLEDSKREINELRGELRSVRKESLLDPLTGLLNRKGLDEELGKLVSASDMMVDGRCLLMVDIDHFKSVNDTYGHLIGDKVIQFVALSLKKQVKGKDTVARFGGEEYAILLADTSLDGALAVAENIRSYVEKTRIKRSGSGEPIGQITVSVGVSRFRRGESAQEFVGRADEALYRSKNDGRNRVSAESADERLSVGV